MLNGDSMETHIFNEQKRRLEPQNSICVFCGERHIQDVNDSCYLTLYKENSRTNLLVYRNVKFSKITIGASRCKYCKAIHNKVKIKSLLLTVFVHMIGIGLAVLLINQMTGMCIIFGILLLLINIGLMVIQTVYRLFENRVIKQYKVLTKRDGLKVYPIVQELLNDGFSFEEPIA